MKTIVNRTPMPLRLRLPGGKILHLAPGKTGQVADAALDEPVLAALVSAGKIEVVRGTHGPIPGPIPPHAAAAAGHHPPGMVRPRGDR